MCWIYGFCDDCLEQLRLEYIEGIGAQGAVLHFEQVVAFRQKRAL